MGEIKKNTIAYGIRQTILFVLSFVINMYTTRKLTNEDFGNLVYFNTIIAAFGFITDGSVWAGFIQSYNEIKKDTLNKMFSLVCLLLFVIIGIFLLISKLTHVELGDKEFLIYFSIVSIFTNAIQSIIYTKFQKELKISYIAICDILSSLIYYLLVVILLNLNHGIMSVLISMTIKNISCLVFAFIFSHSIFKFDFKFNEKSFLINLKKGLVNLLSFPVNYARTLMNPIIVGNFCNLGAMGIIDRSVLIAGIPSNILTVALQKVLFPVFSNSYNENKDITTQVKSVVYYSSLLDKIYYIPLLLLIKDAVNLFFGVQWEGIIIPVYILTIGNMLFGSISGVCSICLLSTSKFKESFFINLISTLIVVPTTVLLTYFFGVNGYCFCSILLWLPVFIALYLVNKEIKCGGLFYEYFIPFIASILTVSFVKIFFLRFSFFYPWQNVIVKILMSYLTYCSLIILIDRKYIKLKIVELKEKSKLK